MTGRRVWKVSEPYLQLDCGLGEAPFYEKDINHLRFVDIVKQKLHIIDLNRGPSSHKTLDLDVAVGTTADLEGSNEEIVVGAKHGYAILNRNTGRHDYLKRLWDERDGPDKEKRMRLNDGAVDSFGRYWAGAMNDPKVKSPTNEGVLFRLDPDLKIHRIIEDVTIPNGIGWSPDNKIMYFTDTPTSNISKFDFDAATGVISNRQVFFHVDEVEGGQPDGFAVDAQGHLWTAIFGGGKVLRISPEGKAVGEILLPTRSISCPGFAGEDMYITSAEEEEPDKYPDSAKYAGSLFKVNVGVSGLPVHKFRRR